MVNLGDVVVTCFKLSLGGMCSGMAGSRHQSDAGRELPILQLFSLLVSFTLLPCPSVIHNIPPNNLTPIISIVIAKVPRKIFIGLFRQGTHV